MTGGNDTGMRVSGGKGTGGTGHMLTGENETDNMMVYGKSYSEVVIEGVRRKGWCL